jgi:hypothetical protein
VRKGGDGHRENQGQGQDTTDEIADHSGSLIVKLMMFFTRCELF